MEIFEKLNRGNTNASVDYKALIKEGAIVVDVRSEGEFISGNVTGSTNIPLDTLTNQMDALKDKTVVLVCRSGARAGHALDLLTNNGIKAYNAGAWQNIA